MSERPVRNVFDTPVVDIRTEGGSLISQLQLLENKLYCVCACVYVCVCLLQFYFPWIPRIVPENW